MHSIRWRCRRGLLELDTLLNHFLDTHYTTLSDQEKSLFEQLLETPDPVLLLWLTGQLSPPEQFLQLVQQMCPSE